MHPLPNSANSPATSDVVILSGGPGGGPDLVALTTAVTRSGGTPPIIITGTGADLWVHGVRVWPFVDAAIAALSGMAPPPGTATPGARAGDTSVVAEELGRLGLPPTWYPLGDRMVATHLVRTQMLDAGFSAGDIATALAARAGMTSATLVPVTASEVEAHVVVSDEEGRRGIHVAEWDFRFGGAIASHDVVFIGADDAVPTAEATSAIDAARVVVLAPDDPVVGIGSIIAVPGIRSALKTTSAEVLCLDPVTTLRGRDAKRAEQLCAAVGVPWTSAAMRELYGQRSGTGLVDRWVTSEEAAEAVTAG